MVGSVGRRAVPSSNTMPRRRTLLLAAAGCAVLPSSVARAWAPAAPVRVLIGFPPGGARDILVRILADGVRGTGGVTLVPEVRSGAYGFLALQGAARAPGDGLTLASANMGMLFVLRRGDTVTLATPGGGHGDADASDPAAAATDRAAGYVAEERP